MHEKSKSRKQKIIEAARLLFSRYGLEKTTTEDIASALNIRKGALYYYFKNKEEIFAEVIKGEIGRLQEEVEAAVQKTKGVIEQFAAFLKTRMCYLKDKVDEFTTIRDEYLKHYIFIEEELFHIRNYSKFNIIMIETFLTEEEFCRVAKFMKENRITKSHLAEIVSYPTTTINKAFNTKRVRRCWIELADCRNWLVSNSKKNFKFLN